MSRRKRIIDRLRELYPGEWAWDTDTAEWAGPEFSVRAYSVLDGYESDDSFHTEYRRTDNGERVFTGNRFDSLLKRWEK